MTSIVSPAPPNVDHLPALFEQVRAARHRLQGRARATPVETSRTLDQRAGAAVFLKCENLQRIGAFKFRGAYNAIHQLSPDQRRAGIVTHSSGNHGQAVARVGQLLGIPVVVVMPDNAPAIKRRATEGYGAQVVAYNPDRERREAVTARLIAGHGFTLIPPFDHLDIVAGQGTATLELIEQAGPLDALLVPVGGGGLIGGAAIAAKSLQPACRVIGVEPALADDAARSLASGTRAYVSNPQTIADGTRTESLGELNFQLVMHYVDDIVTVSEQAIMNAVAFLFYRTKLVVESSGALGVAALLDNVVRPAGRVGVLLSGGNIDGTTLAGILDAAQDVAD